MKTKIVLADVYYTYTDETYYVLNGTSRYADSYKADTLREAFQALRADGWSKSGKVQRSDYSPVDLFERDGDKIAVWQEAEVGEEYQEEEELLEALGNHSVWTGKRNFNTNGNQEPKSRRFIKTAKRSICVMEKWLSMR